MDANTWLIDFDERTCPWSLPVSELSTPERVLVAVWTLEADVNNGGFDQYT